MSRLCRYAGGLACLVTVLALAACGAGPGSTTQADAKVIGNIAFQQRETIRRIPLVDKFTGKDLTYTATSDKPTVATVEVDNDEDILTVTAVGAGTATITVTAKNPNGEAKQSFTVTVPTAPMEIPDFPYLEEDATRTIRLGDKFSGENLTYGASSSNVRVATATVDNTADTITVTAVGPGTATITVTATAQGSATQTKTFTVTVPEAASAETAPTVKTDATSTVSVAVGATSTVTLSTVFDGATSYTATSSASIIATASESGGTLTIRGVGIGSATVTVTATNTAGSSPAHAIAVTVTAPATTTTPTPTPTNNPSSCKSPLEIQRDDHADCTLPNDHSLVYSKPDGELERVRVEGPDSSETRNVWTITAIRKGTPVVQVRDNDTGNTVGEITVIVPNSPPRLKIDENSRKLVMADGTIAEKLGSTALHSLTIPSSVNIASSFTDVDDVDNDEGALIGNYKVQHKPDELLIKTVRGFLLEQNDSSGLGPIDAVVLKPFTEDFSIEVYAYDPDNAQSNHPITVNFSVDTPVNPRAGTYAVKQKENGDFEPMRVGNRLSIPGTNTVVKHTLQFHNAAGIDRAAFQFASNLNGTLTKPVSGKAYLAAAPNLDATAVPLCGGLGPNTNTVPDKESLSFGTGCYTYTTTNRVEVPAHADFDVELGDEPQIHFILPSKTNGLNSGSATITIKYHVHAYSARQDHSDPLNTIPDNAATRIHTASESLRINIHKCVVTSDCPIE